jgi:GST-like protein
MFACTDVAGTGGTLFQLANHAPEKSAANVEFFEKRLAGFARIADERLAGREYLADEFSLADLALYPVASMRRAAIEKHGAVPHLAAWLARMTARPAVAKGMQVSA